MTTTEPSTSDTTDAETAHRKAEALRRLADMIEEHPEIHVAYLHDTYPMSVWCPHTGAELKEIARAAKAHGAKVDKKISGDRYNLVVSWHGIRFQALGARDEVCERVKVGEETITEQVPDPTVDVPMVSVTKTVDKFEWRCSPLLTTATGEVSQ